MDKAASQGNTYVSLLFGFASRHRSIIGEGTWLAGSQILRAVAGLVGIRLVTEYVPPYIYGVAGLLLGIEVLARNIFCQPFLNACIRFYPEALKTGHVTRLRQLTAKTIRQSSIPPAILCLVGALLAPRWEGLSFFAVAVLAALYFAESLRDIDLSLYTASRRQKAFSIWTAAEGIARPFIIVAAVLLLGPRVGSVLFGNAVAVIIPLIAAIALADRVGMAPDAGRNSEVDARLSKAFFRYGLPLMPVAVMGWLTAVGDRYVIGAFLDPTSVGIYVATYGLVSQPFLMVGGIVALTLRPVYFHAVSSGDVKKARRVFFNWMMLTVGVSLLGVLAFLALQNVVANILLAKEYRPGAALMPWIGFGYLIFGVEQVLENYLLAHKRTSAILVAQVIGGVGAVAITIPMVAYFGLLGAAIAWPLYATVLTLGMVILVRGVRTL